MAVFAAEPATLRMVELQNASHLTSDDSPLIWPRAGRRRKRSVLMLFSTAIRPRGPSRPALTKQSGNGCLYDAGCPTSFAPSATNDLPDTSSSAGAALPSDPEPFCLAHRIEACTFRQVSSVTQSRKARDQTALAGVAPGNATKLDTDEVGFAAGPPFYRLRHRELCATLGMGNGVGQ